MENESELNAKILKISMLIQDQYPELSKYLTEMPITLPDKVHPEVNIKNLKEYCLSVEILLKKYIEYTHIAQL